MIMKILYLDVSKAFDKVWRKALVHKMKKMGVCGDVLGWFANYLEGRLQRVVMSGYFSVRTEIISGVPQGSILVPSSILCLPRT